MSRKHSTLATLGVVAFIVLVSVSFGSPFASSPKEDLQFQQTGAQVELYYSSAHTSSFGNGGAGVYVTDFNNDRRPDVLAIGGREPELFRNIGGTFEQANALPELETSVKSALFFDYDNDGWNDLLLLPVAGSPVFFENRNGNFQRRDVGLGTEMDIAIGASAADYNGDGCLDLFVIQGGDWRRGVPKGAISSVTRPVENDNGNPNLLFSGDCESFKRINDAGIEGTRWSTSTSFVDMTDDGWPDIHVANDYNTDILYVNQQNGTFERRELAGTDRHGMSSEVADINDDHQLDLFVTNIHFDKPVWGQQRVSNADNRGNNLLVNQGNGSFTTKERVYNVRDGGWGWAAALVDLDNDGDQDLIHTTKNYLQDSDGDGAKESFQTRPRIWRRTGTNFTKLNASKMGFKTSSGRGLAYLDYDGDGDQDLIVANNNGPFKLYENQVDGRNWLQIKLRGHDAHTTVGSQVYVTTDDGTQYRMSNAKADFLSQDSRTLHFGLGEHQTVTVRVVWSDGIKRSFRNVSVNRRVLITRNKGIRPINAERNASQDSS